MSELGPDPHGPLADYLASDRGRADVAALADEMKRPARPHPIVAWVSTALAQVIRIAVATAIVVLVLRGMGVDAAR